MSTERVALLREDADRIREFLGPIARPELRVAFCSVRPTPGRIGTRAASRIRIRTSVGLKGSEFDHDIEWNVKDGYVRGEGSEAAERWIDEEAAKEIRFTFDSRGAADPGVC